MLERRSVDFRVVNQFFANIGDDDNRIVEKPPLLLLLAVLSEESVLGRAGISSIRGR